VDTTQGLAAFVGVAALMICTPGPDTALVVRVALAGGRRAGMMAALGVGIGLATWSLAASAGVAGLLHASPVVFAGLELGGAAVLVALGARAIGSAVRPAPAAAAAGVGPGRALRQGLLSNLGNPKIAVFFTGLLPQFAPGGGASFGGLLLLGGLFCAMTVAWLGAYAAAVDRAARLLTRPAVRRALEALSGAVLVALGVRLAAEVLA